ncbi:hypothetical protein A2U01_0081928, partial [Trifolium medium]|nr:hypothetical protein [Trifolium medium]
MTNITEVVVNIQQQSHDLMNPLGGAPNPPNPHGGAPNPPADNY